MVEQVKAIIPILKQYKIENAIIGAFQGRGIDPNDFLIIYITIENNVNVLLQEKKELLLKTGINPKTLAYELNKIVTYELEDLLDIDFELITIPIEYINQLYMLQDLTPFITLLKYGNLVDDITLTIQIDKFKNSLKRTPDMLLKSFVPIIYATLAYSIPRIEYISALKNFIDPNEHMKSKQVFAMRDKVLQDYFRVYIDILSLSKLTDLGMNMDLFEDRCAMINAYKGIAETNCIRKLIGVSPYETLLRDDVFENVWEDHQEIKDFALKNVQLVRKMEIPIGGNSESAKGDAIDFMERCHSNRSDFVKQDLKLYEDRLGNRKQLRREQMKYIINI